MILLKPMFQSAEEVFKMLLQMIDTDKVGLLIIDSLGNHFFELMNKGRFNSKIMINNKLFIKDKCSEGEDGKSTTSHKDMTKNHIEELQYH